MSTKLLDILYIICYTYKWIFKFGHLPSWEGAFVDKEKNVKKLVFLLFTILVGVLWILPAMAQTIATEAYVVKQYDTLYQLSAIYKNDPLKWREVLGANPFLKEPGRVYNAPNGKIIVVIRPGEVLKGLMTLGIEPAKVLSFDSLKAQIIGDTKTVVSSESRYSSSGFWFLFFAFIIIALACWHLGQWWKHERELERNPVTSGPPIVAGGIPATDAARLENHFRDRAVAQYVQTTPGTDASLARTNIVRVGPIEEGMISGEGMVGYADRTRPRRINPPQSGYRATFRFPDGSEQQLMSLQGCMNPCYYGEGLSGFTFTAERVAVPVPEPPVQGPQPAPHPAIAVRRIRESAQVEGQNTVTIGDETMVFPKGYHVNVNKETGEVTLNATEFEMKMKPRRKRIGTNRERPATGTEN